jgi:hypothetical protein
LDTRDKIRTWVKALKSGKFQQTQESLRNTRAEERTDWSIEDKDGNPGTKLIPAGYCCLGVLKKVCPKDFKHTAWDAGFLDDDEAVKILGDDFEQIQEALADLNDKEVPFEMIAGTIKHAFRV